MVQFEIIKWLSEPEIIVVNCSIREKIALNKEFGKGRWRKLKRNAVIKKRSNIVRQAEIHYYECSSFGKVKAKIKRYLD